MSNPKSNGYIPVEIISDNHQVPMPKVASTVYPTIKYGNSAEINFTCTPVNNNTVTDIVTFPYDHYDDLLATKIEQHVQRTDNPHNVTKYQVGLGNVDNISSEDIIEAAKAEVEIDEERLEAEIQVVAERVEEVNDTLQGEIDKILPDLSVVEEPVRPLVLEDNAEITISEVVSGTLNLQIPANIQHGYCSYLVFTVGTNAVDLHIENEAQSSYPIHYIQSGEVIPQIELNFSCQYNLIALCNGVNVEVYIQEITLGV